MIKPDLKGEFKQLCTLNNSVTDFLLGEDVAKQIKDINEAQKVGFRVSGGKQRHTYAYNNNRFQPYQKNWTIWRQAFFIDMEEKADAL